MTISLAPMGIKKSNTGNLSLSDIDGCEPTDPPANFIEEAINADLASKRFDGKVCTRFPPEPNGYLHIGHAKSICLNFGLAERYGGTCNLRFDDTNPAKEEVEYVESIKEDVEWLGFEYNGLYFASDYFEQLYQHAVELINAGRAYVCSLTPEKIREYRGNFHEPGKNSPDRDRTAEENLALFEKMRAGEFEDGAHVLRAKIDMASPNMNLRDPPLYRIKRAHHHRTGDDWCIYPMYDFAHGLSDSIEKITHSICTLEFEDHRPLYDWLLESLDVFHPQQIEFARLNMGYTMMSKRRLLELVQQAHVSGWDDPRMPTLRGMRRRGYTPEAIRDFAERVGVAKAHAGIADQALLEYCVREDLNSRAPRVMGVLRPLKIVINNFPEGHVEEFEAPYFPDEPERGTRTVRLTREVYIERDDFREEAPKKWFRFAPGREVRLRFGCLVTCVDVIKDADGEVVELHCIWDPESKGGTSPDGRRVKGTSHWVSAEHSLPAEVRLYDRLFTVENPLADKDVDYKTHLNPDSLEVLTDCRVERSLSGVKAGDIYQFERLGYFCVDPDTDEKLVFNRAVTLRDSWAKIEKKLAAKKS